MKAIVCTKYGPPEVLQLKEVKKPAPKDDEVLIKVHAVSINSRDWRLMRANPFFIHLKAGGLLKPKNSILGVDAAGRVEAVGSNARQFRPGDEVFGYLSRYGGRTFAEYVCAGEDEIALKPASLTFEQAAAVPLAAITALQGLRDKGNIQSGQKVLIQGASGSVGTFADGFPVLSPISCGITLSVDLVMPERYSQRKSSTTICVASFAKSADRPICR
jgi:NADPH:quinone reductase-like Zn-dependent oxidoreductase